MNLFRYSKGELFCEDVKAEAIAKKFGTPLYVYSVRSMLDHYRKLRQAFDHTEMPRPTLICYSVKANSNLTIMNIIKNEGAGFDVVSGGELYRAMKIGGDPKKVVFAGVGKTEDEIELALKHGVLLLNVESEEELYAINSIAKRMKKIASLAIRVNPDVDPKTHTYITTGKKENKFGVNQETAIKMLKAAGKLKNVRINGLHVHIGSQITTVEPYVKTLSKILEFIDRCKSFGFEFEYLDIGGGFGIWYKEKTAKTAKEIADALMPIIIKTGLKVILEPGRFIIGNAGILLTRVLYVKESGDKRFVICDAGMSHLIRPMLYNAYHRIWPIKTVKYSGEVPDEENWKKGLVKSDVVGPICETGDAFAVDRMLPPVKGGDLLAIFTAGAYGYAMSSNYNSHPRPAEIIVYGKNVKLATKRETYDNIVKNESILTIKL